MSDLLNNARTPGRSLEQQVARGIAGRPGLPDIRTITIDASASPTDLVADETAVTVAELITLDNFASGKKHATICFNAAGGQIPHAGAVGIHVNGTPGEAVAALSISNAGLGSTNSASNGPPCISQFVPVAEVDLRESSDDIDTIYLAPYDSGGTGAGLVKITVIVK